MANGNRFFERFSYLIILLLQLPGLFMLAHFPQSPDGSEMLTTALNGGVMHPSGLPLQAWLDRLFVLNGETPALGLSFLSWLAGGATQFVLFALLRRLGTRPGAALMAVIAYAFSVPVATLALQPEKYALMAFLQIGFIYMTTGPTLRRADYVWMPLVFALGLAQHTALVIMTPFLLLPALECWRRGERHKASTYALATIALTLLFTAAFYLSLLWLRAVPPWPDWGRLESLGQLWDHVSRREFGGGLINAQDTPSDIYLSGLGLLWSVLKQWTVLMPLLPFGLYLLFKSNRTFANTLSLSLCAGLGVLVCIELPASDFSTAMGYGERYPCLLLPLLTVALGVGIDQMRGWALSSLVLMALGYTVSRALPLMRQVDSRLIEVYRNEVAREFRPEAMFVSTSELDLFYGIPCAGKVCFPLKNLFGSAWYRERTAPALDPRVREILSEFQRLPWSYAEFLRQAHKRGYVLLSTSGDLFITEVEFQGHITQRGLVWLVTREPVSLYDSEIEVSARELCQSLERAPDSVAQNGNYFLHELVHKINFVFVSAGDARGASVACPALLRIAPWL